MSDPSSRSSANTALATPCVEVTAPSASNASKMCSTSLSTRPRRPSGKAGRGSRRRSVPGPFPRPTPRAGPPEPVVHAVDGGQHVGHDHVVQQPHGRGRPSAQMGRQTASPRSNAASNARCHRAPARPAGVAPSPPAPGACPAWNQARLFRPAHDQVQARSSAALRNLSPHRRCRAARSAPGIGRPDVPAGVSAGPAGQAIPRTHGAARQPCCVRPPR